MIEAQRHSFLRRKLFASFCTYIPQKLNNALKVQRHSFSFYSFLEEQKGPFLLDPERNEIFRVKRNARVERNEIFRVKRNARVERNEIFRVDACLLRKRMPPEISGGTPVCYFKEEGTNRKEEGTNRRKC
jgi:hypothetical protein